jgi:hypothetical protein
MSVEIVEVLGRSVQGVTRPFICRGDDGNLYFVKGRSAGRRSLICEWICANLAKKLELPIAPFEIVHIPEELIIPGLDLELTELGAGPAFGSRRLELMEVNYSMIFEIPDELQQQVLMFDLWINNADRTLSQKGGNPNLFWVPDHEELIVIDHNQAFDPDFCREEVWGDHVFSDQQNLLVNDIIIHNE